MVGTATVGHTVTLDASGPGRRDGRRIDARWTLLDKPMLSHARLGAATGTTSSLRPDVPGTYRVALRTGAGANAGYDVLTVATTDPSRWCRSTPVPARTG